MTEKAAEARVFMGSEAICAALRDRYPAPEWILAFEVANGTGSTARRSADAVAMNCYPSKGCELLGFEIKISRGDWLRELKASTKAVPVGKFCDRWYVVAPDGVVKREELPRGWGLITAMEKALRVVVQPPANEQVQDVNRSFMAAMLRRAGGPQEAAIRSIELRAEERGAARERSRIRDNDLGAAWENKFLDLRRKVEEFEKASGLHIQFGWDLANHGEACRDLRDVNETPKRLRDWSAQLKVLQAKIESVLGVIEVAS